MSACDNLPRTWTHEEIADIAADEAQDVVAQAPADRDGQISDLESRMDDLEAENQQLREQVASTESEISTLRSQLAY